MSLVEALRRTDTGEMFAGSLRAYATGLSLGISLIIAIGAQNAFVLRQGLARSHVRLVVAVCVLLDAMLMTVGVSGVASALGRTPWALDGVALAGAGFLGWYGLAAARRARSGTSALAVASGSPRGARQALTQTLAVSLLNPHVYLDTVLLIGSVGAQQPRALRGAFLAGSCSASLGWFVTLGFGARLLAPLFARPQAWRVLDTVVALVMWSVAAALLLRLVPG